ncbi:hypothetical protein J3R30DRAFT_2586777 [Lentinula aciculospora]|uniref:Mixed lineage kinase domain-containing protein n=1 Tax=Lentinula aciculospora TaxID=153920 RepID=A0A9W9DPH5_9AGAR|nr:hypothetical protein J3R30DRAFT_2586777 [Lentinula aciculospora]
MGWRILGICQSLSQFLPILIRDSLQSIVFSYPGSSFFNELNEVARRLPDIEQRGVKVVGLSRNWPNEDLHWNKLLQHYNRQPESGRNVQIIADDRGRLSSLYGMLSQRDSDGVASNPNTAFLVDPMKIIRVILPYPSFLSTGLTQILRFVDDNAGPLEDIPADMFGLDSKGRGQIYEQETKVTDGGSTDTVAVVKSAASLISNLKGATGGDTDGSSNAAAAATDYIQHAMTVMDSLADLGKVMPFVAPAFVLIKAIIAVEQRARDVDAKCTDLVQRVTFMLSHLPALKKINVTDSTRQVIDRMNDTLKKAAALVQTYRKQSAIARRLSVHNKDRFASCASSLSQCTNDLMLSLQIHQSTQLDILTRPVPSDPEDEAATHFVATHGGIDAVKGNEALVKQFATQLKLSVDDNVMEQLNTNISMVLQQNQDRLEQSLNESVSASVIEGIRGLAAQMNESAKEQTFVCVQCDKEYHDSTNGEKSCSFHRSEYDSWHKTYRCCSSQNPCQAGRHRSEQHCDFSYGNFFAFARNITGYTDTTKKWTDIEDFNLETSQKLTVSVARLLRWKSRGAQPELPTILVRVGQVSISEPYLFKTFNIKDLELISKVVDITHQTVIFRISHSEQEFAMAEWVLSPTGVIVGIKITAKAATSNEPFIRLCPIDITSCKLSGDVRSLSEGGLRSFKPRKPYVLPEIQRVSATLHEGAPREVRKDFKTRTTPNLPVVMKLVSDPPLVANPQYANSETDYFGGTISVFNKHKASSMEPISIASVTAFYRFVGDEKYQPVKLVEILDGITLPYTIDPRQTLTLKFGVVISRSEEDTKIGTRWWNRAFVARERPVRIKLVLTDIEEEECSLVLDYVCPVPDLQKADKDDLAYFYVDDPLTWQRYGVHIAKDPRSGVKIGNDTRNADWMKTVVYQALKTGESEIALDIGAENDTGKPTAWSWKTWALVDLSCRRLYAFKILITKTRGATQAFACMGYVSCPEYGGSYDESRPIRYAKEVSQFPELNPSVVFRPIVLDDELDDSVPETSQATSMALNTGLSSQLASSNELQQRLASIDNNLSRLAISMEQLVEIMKNK